MAKRLVRTAILIGFVVIIIVLNICVNSTRQEDGMNGDGDRRMEI